jgi:pimeloyl-ACP methyl ester carboxylesterase
MKTVFLIAGFRLNQTAADPKFKELREAIAAKGYGVLGVPITWNRKAVSDYLKLFLEFYEKNKSEQNIIVGCSYGAMVTFLAAPMVRPDKILLCSLSPYFREDMLKRGETRSSKKFGKSRTADHYSLLADSTAKKLNQTDVESVFMVGEQELGVNTWLTKRVRTSAKAVKNSKYVEVPDAPHTFRDPAYIKGIAKEL